MIVFIENVRDVVQSFVKICYLVSDKIGGREGVRGTFDKIEIQDSIFVSLI